MASYADNLIAIRDALVAKQLEVAQDTDHHLTYNVDGQYFDWTGYMKYLDDAIALKNQQIAAAQPFEIITQAYT